MIGLFGSGGTTGDVTNNFYGISQYSSIAALKGATAPADGTKVVVGGHTANGDGGGGVFYYDEASSADDDGGTIIAPTEGSGRWKRVHSGAVDVRWFGAKGDGETDDSAAFAAALDVALASCTYAYSGTGDKNTGWSIYIPGGDYLITDNNVFGGTSKTGQYIRGRIFGDGWGNSRIVFCPAGGDDFAGDDKYYLYDGGNGTTNNEFSIVKLVIDNIGIKLDVSDLVAGDECGVMRMYGDAGGQNLETRSVSVVGPNDSSSVKTVFLDITGNVNGSDSHFVQSEFRYCTHLLRSKNPQGVNLDFVECDVWGMTSHFLQIDPGGGLEIRSHGGSWIWSDDPDNGHQYLLNIASTPPSVVGATHITDTALNPAEAWLPTAAEVAAYCSTNSIVSTSVYYTGTDTSGDAAIVKFTVSAASAVTACDWGNPFRSTYGIAKGNFTVLFTGVKVEMKHAGSRLVYSPADQDILSFVATGVNFAGGGITGQRSATVLGPKKSVRFIGCVVPEEFRFRFTADNADLGTNKWSLAGMGQVSMTRCGLGGDLSDNAILDFVCGRVIADGCSGHYGMTSAPDYNVAVDFDTNPYDVGYIEAGPRVKSVSAKVPQRLWTSSAVYGAILPYGSRIAKIEVHKPGAGGSSPQLTITVADGDGTTLAASDATNANVDIIMLNEITGANRLLKRTTTNQRTITVTVSGGAFTAVTGGFARIEYI